MFSSNYEKGRVRLSLEQCMLGSLPICWSSFFRKLCIVNSYSSSLQVKILQVCRSSEVVWKQKWVYSGFRERTDDMQQLEVPQVWTLRRCGEDTTSAPLLTQNFISKLTAVFFPRRSSRNTWTLDYLPSLIPLPLPSGFVYLRRLVRKACFH